MNKHLLSALYALPLLVGNSIQADIEVGFFESAPKDRFVIKNTGKCLLQNLTLEIDLTKSAGKLIFDTTATGAGVEVFQPFEVTKGNIKLASSATVKDGDSKLTLNVPSLPSNNSVSFTIDVDDTLPVSELGKIRVSGSEIKNGMVKVSSNKTQASSAVFGTNSKAVIVQPAC